MHRLVHAAIRERRWRIGIIDCPLEEWVRQALYLEATPELPVRWIEPAGPSFIADPCAYSVHGKPWVAFERFIPRSARGEVWSMPLDGPTPMRNAVRSLADRNYHYAFPCVTCTADGGLVAVCDSSHPALSLYTVCPQGAWTPRQGPSGIPRLTDPTLHSDDVGHWIVGLATNPDRTLGVYYSPALEGPWVSVPTASNLPREDVRPAGRLIPHATGLIRPSQSMAAGYGSGIWLNAVTRLDPLGYEEEPRVHLEAPDSWPHRDGFHTISGVGGLTVVDACSFALSPFAGVRRVRGRLLASHRHGLDE